MTVSAITLPNVDAMVAAAHQSVENAVEGVRDAAKRTLLALTQPYRGYLVPPVMEAIAASGGPVPVSDSLGFHPGRGMRNKKGLMPQMRRMSMRSAEINEESAPSTFTYACSNSHVEEATSASLTDSSSLTMWADDFSHEGI